MLEKPSIPDETLVSAVQVAFGLRVTELIFLPLGADQHTAAYRVEADKQAYFLKLRSGVFHEASVTLPRHLSDRGIGHLIVPLETLAGDLWAELGPFHLILCPFITGRDGYEMPLSERQWVDFGRTVRRIHTLALPADLRRQIRSNPVETHWGTVLSDLLVTLRKDPMSDALVVDLAHFVSDRDGELRHAIERTQALGQMLRVAPPDVALCHSDLHAGNILIEPDGDFYIVDWDDPILAPKERDLMFIGGGYWGSRQLSQSEALFYRGYGTMAVDWRAVAAYRYARAAEDIALFCKAILDPGTGLSDRQQSFVYLRSAFEPYGALDAARAADRQAGVF